MTLFDSLDHLFFDVHAALGGAFIGAFLFGSHARGSARPSSDIDLALIVSELSATEAHELAKGVLARSPLARDPVALSVETYPRLKYLLESGDPFAWVICLEGKLLRDPLGLLDALRRRAVNGDIAIDPQRTMKHLRSKAEKHGRRAVERLYDALGEAQLAAMAVAQEAALIDRKPPSGEDLVGAADWTLLESRLTTYPHLDALGALTVAHKLCREEVEGHPGRDLINLLRVIGVWPPDSEHCSNEVSGPLDVSAENAQPRLQF